WKALQPVQPWNGIRSIAEWGPRCVQSSRLGDLDPLNKRMDEDCLYLNVWTPATSSSQSLPVMVWIHGGSNLNGAGSQPEFDGSHLASKGVVVVTINYRLDVFGFLAHPEGPRNRARIHPAITGCWTRLQRSSGCRGTYGHSVAIPIG